MKSLATLFAMLCVAAINVNAQSTTVTIGTGTSSSSTTSGPMYISSATSTFRYSKQAAVYEASEISAGGGQSNSLITAIRWYRASAVGGYDAGNAEMKIYIKGVSYSSFPSSPINWANETSDATLVYSSTTQNINSSAGWQEFTLDDAYLWDGNENLQIMVEWYRPSNALGATSWRYTSKSLANAITGSSANNTTATRNSNRPNIQLEMIPAIPAEYESSTVTQITGNVVRGENNYRIIRLAVTTSGFIDPLSLTQINFNTNGTTNPEDINTAKIYYTGTSSTFNTSTLYGQVSDPSGNISLEGSRELVQGTNYFWLAYDIDGNATPGNVVDGEIFSFELTQDGTSNMYSPSGTTTGSRTIIGRLSGSFTVGTGGNYETLAEAFEEINAAGLEGDATFNIISDLNESNIPALIQRAETGGSFTMTIRPSGSPRTITGNQANALIMLNGSDRVTIDGTIDGTGNNLTFINNTADAAVVQINGSSVTNGTDDIIIRNTNVVGGSNTATNTYGISVLGSDNDNITIEDNMISRVSTGIIVRGSSTAAMHDNMDIVGNTIGGTSSSDYVLLRGIDVQYVSGGLISENQITDMLPTSSTTIAAIELGQNVNTTQVTRNKIHNLRNDFSTGGAYGINISTSTGNTSNVIANNFVSGVSTLGAASSTTNNAFGIRIAGGSGHEVYYNTVNMSGNFGGTAGLSSAFLITSGSDINVRNNIFINNNSASSAGPKSYAIYSSVTSPFLSINYNNYSVEGNPNGVLGYRSGTEATTLDEWRTLTQQDANSVSKPVSFVNEAAGDLHLSEVDTVLARGAALSTQLVDIDGEIRKNTYMGADEVLPTIVITSQPPALTQCVGSTYVLQSEATVDFNAILKYEWRRNGVPLFDNLTYSGTSTPTLTIRDAEPSDAGIYVLTITSNSGTSIESEQINVVVNSPIIIEEEPQSVLACLNENIMFSVPNNGTVTGYQWQKKSPAGFVNIPGETRAGIILNNANFATTGIYRLLLFGGCGGADTVSTREATVFIIPQNNLITEPEDRIAATGSTVSIRAGAYAGPSITYQWYKGSTPLVDNERINGSTSSVLTINDVELSDAGSNYSVQVTGKCGTGSSRQVTLTVIQPNIFITQQPASDTVCSGGSATFTTQAETSLPDAELTYRWMRDGAVLTNDAGIAGATTPTLTISDITTANAGAYTVEVTTAGGAPVTSDVANLTVASTPVISQQPESVSVCENEELTLSLSTNAVGATYQWKLNGVDIAGATNSAYTITNATAANAGTYTVTVTNTCGQATSEAASVTFSTLPAITQQPQPNVNLSEGEGFTLTVAADGSGTLAYQWMKDGVDLAGETQATYTVANANKFEHMGKYTVRITNSCGDVVSAESNVGIVSGINDADYTQGIILESNQPNPFSDRTSISYILPDAMHVNITVTDMHGREIAILANGFKNAGTNTVVLNAAELNMPSGIYMYTLTTGSGYRQTKQLIIAK